MMDAKTYLNPADVYTLKCRPDALEALMREEAMRISLEKERVARLFPWKRKGYRKHVK